MNLYEKYSAKIFLISGLWLLLIAVFSVICFLIINKWRRNFKKLEEQNIIFLHFQLLFHLIRFKFDFSLLVRYLCSYSKLKGYLCLKIFMKQFVLLSHPEYIQIILNDKENFDRPYVKEAMGGLMANSLLLSNGEEWKIRKELINPLFRQNILEMYLPIMEYNSKLLIEKLYKKKQQWISIIPVISYCYFKIGFETIFNFPKDSVISEYYYPIYIKNIKKTMKPFWSRMLNIFMWNDFIFYSTSTGRVFLKAKNSCKKTVQEAIDRKIEMINERMKNKNFEEVKSAGGIFDYYVMSNNSIPYITKESLIDEIISLLGGVEYSTSKTTSLALYFIGRDPDIQRKVHDELDSVFQEINDDCISANLYKLKYLECVIKETMRLYPFVPLVPRITKKEYHFSDKRIQKDSIIFISIYDLHRNSNVFPDPEMFDPERHSSEKSLNQHPFSFIPFSKGIRMCIGHRYAMMVMKITLSYILRNFCVESYPEDFTVISNGVFLEIKEAIQIKLKPRQI